METPSKGKAYSYYVGGSWVSHKILSDKLPEPLVALQVVDGEGVAEAQDVFIFIGYKIHNDFWL